MTRLSLTLIAPLLAALLALAFGLIFLGYGVHTGAGVPVFPLDDSYIHLQYGWQAAQGSFLRYNPGDDPTTGATSLLYLLLLAAGFALGVVREAMPGAILALNLGLFMASAALLTDLGRRAAELMRWKSEALPAWGVGLLAGALFAGSGWMAWAFCSGMETGLLIALVSGALWASAARHAKTMAFFAALAALTRPEGLILAVVLLAAEVLARDPAETNDHARRFAWAGVAVGVGLIPFAVNLLMTGTFSAAGLQAKSWLTLQPFYPDRVIGEILSTALLLVRAFGLPAPDAQWHAFPLAQLFGGIGLALLLARNVRTRRLALAFGGWWLLGIAATATLQTATWHHYRYQMPLLPAILIPAAVALARLARDLSGWLPGRTRTSAAALAVYKQTGVRRSAPPRWRERVAGVALALLALAWAGYSLPAFGAAYALDTTTVLTQQMVLADWLRANTPPDSRIAVHDVGAMRYLGGRDTLDVVGLTSPGMAPVNRSGPGSIYEALEQARPDYYAVYPAAAPPYFGLDVAAALFGQELFRVAVDPFSPYASAGGVQIVAQPDWSGVALADNPQQPSTLEQLAGWTLVERFDVADVQAEAEHDHQWWNSERLPGFATEPRRMAYREDPSVTVTDGGRLLTGGESFTLRTQPGVWAALVVRLHQTDDLTLRVRVNDADAGLWRLPAIPGEWLESVFLVPPDLIRGSTTRFTLEVEEAAPGARYSPFYYWLYQGQAAALPPPPATISGAAFDDVALLRGFDLPGRLFAPGDAIPLTLHWEALTPPRADLRIFVHLIDPANDTAEGILAQYDAPPRRGTYPFWVWRARESVRETVTLQIPADAPAGEYLLLAGIYDAATGARLPIVGGDDYGADRLVLARITLR